MQTSQTNLVMNCPVSIKPTINGLKEKYPDFNYTWTTVTKDSIIREGLEKLAENELKLLGLKNICKKQWNFESDCEYDVVVKDLSRRFGETKRKYVAEFYEKFPAMFSKIIHQPSVDQFVTKTTEKTVEKSLNSIFFQSSNLSILVSEENEEKVLRYVIQLNKLSS